MGGRIYDSTLGRFFQADPHIQAPNNTQNYNRYSYVLNNPMSYTDPSGFFFKSLFKKIAKNKILNFIAQTVSCAVGGPAGCAAYAAASTYAVTGSLSGALKAGAIAFVTAKAFQQIGDHFSNSGWANDAAVEYGFNSSSDYMTFGGNSLTGSQVARQITAHALVGGVTAELQGGKFGHGFISAGVTKGAGGAFLPSGNDLPASQIAGGTVISAVIGGTVSQLTGGKFANGAKTAAYQYLYNQVKIEYESIFDKKIATIDKEKLSISLESPGLEVISLDTDGNLNGPALSLNGQTLGLDGKLNTSAPIGPPFFNNF